MGEAVTTRPDVLVLGGGGTLGIQWMRGVLAGLEEAAGIDARQCEYFVGTSAGSVVGAALAAGVRPGDRWRPPAVAHSASAEAAGPSALAAVVGEAAAWGVAATSPLAPALLRLQRPGAAALRAAALRVAPRRRTVPHQLRRYLEGLGATFDGRLRITAVDRRSGKRVVFGSPGAPPATVAEAALASCAIPWVFAPVRIGDREYVDGGAWSPSNADVSPAGRGAEVLCLLPVLSMGLGERRAVFRAIRSATRALAFAEAQALRARGARVQIVAPDLEAAQAMGSNYMDAGRRKAVLNAGWAQGRALASG